MKWKRSFDNKDVKARQENKTRYSISYPFNDTRLVSVLAILSAIPWREQVIFQWDDDDVRFALDQHHSLDFYSASSLKQQSANRHVAPLGHVVLIPCQPVFDLSPWWCVLSGEATNLWFDPIWVRNHDLQHSRRAR
jgi:hypothetical protein